MALWESKREKQRRIEIKEEERNGDRVINVKGENEVN